MEERDSPTSEGSVFVVIFRQLTATTMFEPDEEKEYEILHVVVMGTFLTREALYAKL